MSQPVKIEEIISELRSGNLDDPAKLSNFLVMLSASLMSASNFEAEAEILKNRKWLELKAVLKANGKEKTDKEADAEVTQSEEWREWRRMRDANRAILETIRALKKKLSVVIY